MDVILYGLDVPFCIARSDVAKNLDVAIRVQEWNLPCVVGVWQRRPSWPVVRVHHNYEFEVGALLDPENSIRL